MASTGAPPRDKDTFEARRGENRDWDRLLAKAGKSSLEQSRHYGDAVAALHGTEVRRRVIHGGPGPVALVQGFRTRHLGFGSVNRIVRGPVWLEELTARQRLETCRAIRGVFRKRVTDLLFWVPDLPDTAESMGLMRALGMRRMVTGYATLWLDIRPHEDRLRSGLHGKWRNALGAAEKAGIRVRAAGGNRAFEESMAAYDSFRRNRRLIGPPADLIRHMHRLPGATGAAGNVRVWNAIRGNQAVAGIAVVRHGAAATYLAGWTSAHGRRGNAHNILLWRAITELRKTGTGWLDLGGVDTASAPGLARFKLGLGGTLQISTGTYL